MPSSPVSIPPLFFDRMQRFLGQDFAAFASAMDLPPVSGLRVNTLKLPVAQFWQASPFPLGDEVAWCPSAFTLPPLDASPGTHPYHLAGLYYLQDPSAMSPAELIAPHPGERILDLAAAPGGKTTHLAALMQGRGLLVANEIKDKRVGHLAQNVERWGAGNVVITNESPERLADHFGAYFDRVLVDAPCSGEGMFRKDMGARADWSPEMIEGCAVRQGNILRVAAKLVRPGGYLLYSTCTFAPEEDEGVIAQLMEEFPAFEVVTLPQFPGFMPGQPEWLDGLRSSNQRLETLESGLDGAVRLFPHRVQGEGHFACLLYNAAEPDGDASQFFDDRLVHPARAQLGFWRQFAADVLSVGLAEDRLRVVGDRLYYIPDEWPGLGRLRFVHPGVWLGLFKKDRFEPAHPLALFLKAGQARKTFSLPADSRELAAYLRGESIPADATGWTVVCVDGFPIGWGKGVQGVLKNHFPRGWALVG